MITASIVLYKTSEEQLSRLINCVYLSGRIDRLYLIDNSPNPLNYPFFQQPFITFLRPNKNIGYGSGHNIALREILEFSQFHFIINPDIHFCPKEIGLMIDRMNADQNIGLLMPKVVYPDGGLQYLCKLIPSPVDLLARLFLGRFFSKTLHKKNDLFELRFTGYSKEMDVPYLSGCFMLFRTSALKVVGLFDERFFMYPEDIDISRRMHRKFRTIFYPDAVIVHDHAKESYKSIKMLLIHIFNMIRYFNKWGWFYDDERIQINKKIIFLLKQK